MFKTPLKSSHHSWIKTKILSMIYQVSRGQPSPVSQASLPQAAATLSLLPEGLCTQHFPTLTHWSLMITLWILSARSASH